MIHRPLCLVLVVVSMGSLGCGADDETGAAAPECTRIGDTCVGVPAEPVCAEATCTGGVGCAAVLNAASQAELDAALAQASAGECIAVAPGKYGPVALPGGVSLLGRSAAEVEVGAITVADGAGAWIRGLTAAGGVLVGSATGMHLEAVKIAGGAEGRRGGPASSLTLVLSEVSGTTSHGVVGDGPQALTIERSIVRDSAGPGVWVQCADANLCGCPEKPTASLDRVLLVNNRNVSANFIATRATLRRVEIRDTAVGADFQPGAGLIASGCSELAYAGVTVSASTSVGVLIDASSAGPAQNDGQEKGIIVIDGSPGIWVQGTGPLEEPGQTVTLEAAEAISCHGSGFGFDLSARGIIVIDGKVSQTVNRTVAVEQGGSADVGVGLMWKSGVSATIDGLEVSGSALQAFVIDGAVGADSSLANVTLTGGDEAKGMIQQQVDTQDLAPTVGANSPALQRNAGMVTSVPLPLLPPSGP